MLRSILIAAVAGTVLSLPIILFLQWWLPQDGPGELIVFIASLPLLVAALLLMRLTTACKTSVTLFALFFWVQVTVFIPVISRRAGPWREIHAMLAIAARAVEDKRTELGIPTGRPLTSDEFEAIKATIVYPRPEYEFPVLGKTVHVRMLTTVAPYVGLSYGHGRNAVFDLETMACTYVD
jgi:hypothetical protein